MLYGVGRREQRAEAAGEAWGRSDWRLVWGVCTCTGVRTFGVIGNPHARTSDVRSSRIGVGERTVRGRSGFLWEPLLEFERDRPKETSDVRSFLIGVGEYMRGFRQAVQSYSGVLRMAVIARHSGIGWWISMAQVL